MGTKGEADLSAIGRLIGEPPRARALMALSDGRQLPASMLAVEAGVAASTMSGHLARLTDGGMITVRQHGRYRYYQLAGPHIAELVEVLARVAPALTITSLREGTRAHAIRRAAAATTTWAAGSRSRSPTRCAGTDTWTATTATST